MRPSLTELAQYQDESFSAEGGPWSMAERVRFAENLYDFLTAGSPEDSDAPPFIRAVGEKNIIWRTGFWNVGTLDTPILVGLEGLGDERGARVQVYIPRALQYKLDLMYHGEDNTEMLPWHDNLIGTVGTGGTGYNMSAKIDNVVFRFWGTDLKKEEFVNFATFGSGSRLLDIAKSIAGELGIS